MKGKQLLSLFFLLFFCIPIIAEETQMTFIKVTNKEINYTITTINKETSVALHGALKVKGNQLVDSKDKPIQLRGLSTHGLAWFPEYVNKETFQYLRDEWHINCIRLALYTDEYGGYCSNGNKEELKKLICEGVSYATELGMYVIIDWHVLSDQNPLKYKNEAIQFFKEMSTLYKDYNNVIYEICNEPNGSGTWEVITSYANEVISIIRANNSNAIILVGTPTWSQEIDKAFNNPLPYHNIMYTLHFYAATHTDWLRERAEQYIEKRLPIFISEFGISDASGNGAVSVEQGNAWKALIEKNNLSYICWNLSNKDESSSILKATCKKLSSWTDEELSTQGKWIKAWLKSESESNNKRRVFSPPF